MGQGSGSANLGVFFGVSILCLLALTKPTHGAIYTVGGSGGWTFNVNSWTNGKSFKAADILGTVIFLFSFLNLYYLPYFLKKL